MIAPAGSKSPSSCIRSSAPAPRSKHSGSLRARLCLRVQPFLGQSASNLTLSKAAKFLLIGCIGLAINSFIQLALRDAEIAGVVYLIAGNLPGVAANFVGNALWTFRRSE